MAAADVLDLSFQGMAVTIARGVLRADDRGESCTVVDSETGELLFSIYAFVFRILVGRMPAVLMGAGLGRFKGFEAEYATGRRK